jgi:hypothetical protein
MRDTGKRTKAFAFALVLMVSLMLSVGSTAAAELEGKISEMAPVGSARMNVLFWDVYDARLLAPDGHLKSGGPFALELTYLRDLDGAKIAERSIEEMRKQGFSDEMTLARWYEWLANLIPDVGEQDQIVGLADEKGSAQFFFNGDLLGVIEEPEFTRRFFDIWLGEKSSEPNLRQQLLGEG